MAIKDIVLIVGAGAHKGYGFPTNADLVSWIYGVAKLKSDPDAKDRVFYHFHTKPGYSLHSFHPDTIEEAQDRNKRIAWLTSALDVYVIYKTGYGIRAIQKDSFAHYYDAFIAYAIRFAESGSTSIDNFLFEKKKEGNGADQIVVIKALAYVILDYQTRKAPFYPVKEKWIELLINTYLDSESKLKDVKDYFPSIVTFNYDTYFENKVLKYLYNKYDMAYVDALKVVNELPVFHVYGKINSDISDQNEILNFKLEDITSIKTVGSERQESELEIIHQIIDKAERTLFLGFGYDQKNLELLYKFKKSNSSGYFHAYSTNYEFGTADINRYKNLMRKHHVLLQIPSTQTSCVDLIRNYIKY